MARARNLKPSFFMNEMLGDCDPLARLLFQGLWCHADREGRLEDRRKKLKISILPYDECDINNLFSQLERGGFIICYSDEGGNYIQIVNFVKHQNPHHMEPPSEIPPPEGHANKFNHSPISPKQRARIYERDGHACVFCGSKEKLQIDHVVMVSDGGTSDDDNLRTLCAQCNNTRSKKPLNSLNPPLLTDSLNPKPEGVIDAGASMPSPREIAERFVEIWTGELGGLLESPRKLTDDRLKACKLRYFTEFGQSYDGWREHCRAIRGSPFCLGENDRGWKADFDWALRPKTILRVLEGKYRGSTTKPSASAQPPLSYSEPWEQRIRGWSRSRFWDVAWGPRPGQNGCRVPPELLSEKAA